MLCGGEAGIGKTRLVAEFCQRAETSGSVILAGGCVDLGVGGLPYGPIAEALRTAIARATLDPARLHAAVVDQLAILVPDLGRAQPGGSAADTELGGLGQVRLFEAVLATLESIATEHPVVLVVEDLHWADRSTQDLLSFLVRNVETAGFMIVATVRTDGVERGAPLAVLLGELSRRPSVERLDLAPHDLAGTVAQVRGILGDDADDRLLRRIHRRSDGNPYFIEQLAHAHLDGEDTLIPGSLRDILLTQLSRQPPDVQALLSAAAVAGPRADETLLAEMLGCSEAEILSPLREAVRAWMLVPTHADEHEAYSFRHALMEEAVESDLLDGDRRWLHARCAQALLARRQTSGAALAQRAAQIAHHRDAAGDIAGTITASIDAALAAEGVAAHADALNRYDRAIQLLDEAPGTVPHTGWDAAEVFHRAAVCAAISGAPRDAARLTRVALERLPAEADPFRRGRLLIDLGEQLWLAGDDGFVDALKHAANVIPPDPPTSVRAEALVALGYHHQITGQLQEAWEAFDEALTTALATGSCRDEAMARTSLATMLLERGDTAGGARELAAGMAAVRRAPPAANTSVVYLDLAAVAGWSGHDELGVELVLEGIAAAQEHGFSTYYGAALAAGGAEGLWSLGRLREASQLIDTADAIGVSGWSEVARRITRAGVLTALGALHRARADMDATVRWADIGDRTIGRWRAVVDAELTLEDGRPEDVGRIIREGLALPPTHVPWADHRACLGWLAIRADADLAELARARRDRSDEAAICASAVAAMAEVTSMLDGAPSELSPTQRRARAYEAMARAEVSRVEGRSEPALWAEAVRAWDGLNWVLRPLYARIREAEARLEGPRADRGTATRLLVDAHREAVGREARMLASMAVSLARRARVVLPAGAPLPGLQAVGPGLTAADPSALYGLTAREVEILALLAEGLTNREIGERLFISPKTAGVHVSNILGKLGVTGRVQAASVAHRLGLSVPREVVPVA